MRARIRRLIAGKAIRIALAVLAIITGFSVATFWYFDRRPQLALKPSTELLIVFDTLSHIRQTPTADEMQVLARHPDEATEFFIGQLIDSDSGSLTHESWSPSMYALAGMGARVVPKLIETIDTARQVAASSRCGDPPSEFCINSQARRLQTRAAMVLGRIGVIDAMPVLLKLRSESELCPLRYEVDTAIKNIENAQQAGTR